MSTESKSIILAESSRLIGQIGNTIVLDLYARVREVEALTRTLGATVERLPKSEVLFKKLIPALIHFQGDLSIAGGGVWPEPFNFDPERERRSFFWGRTAHGELEYFDDYNRSALGYHREAWYCVGRYAKPGRCVWSASYMDPHSYQPMITCTAPMFEAGQFSGVVTIDLKLESLQDFAEAWRKKTGGYVFILDRNNRFITFPVPDLVRNTEQNGIEEPDKKFILTAKFAAKEPLFLPLADSFDEMNRTMLERTQRMSAYQFDMAKKLYEDSYQISQSEAELTAAILADPFGLESFSKEGSTTYLYKTFEIENDFLLKEASTAFLFHVPQSYWKVVIIKPFSEAAMATYSLIQSEKMSGLGQLVAGVSHEVNNPINFIYGNLTYANTYTQELLELVKLYQHHFPIPPAEIQNYLQTTDLSFTITDLPKVLTSMRVGADRIRQLVLSLRNFARMDEVDIKRVDLHEGIESTLLLLDSRLRPRANLPGIQVVKEYGDLPLVDCYPGPLNQVFMNILINAIDALEETVRSAGKGAEQHPEVKSTENDAAESNTAENATAESATVSTDVSTDRANAFEQKIVLKGQSRLTIWIRTEVVEHSKIAIRIADNGPGIPEAVKQRLFDPFFTTKPVGKGTGLGLAICYQIITEKHHGQLRCYSTVGQGSEFYIEIPMRQ